MTSTPAGSSKGKGRAPTDWRLRALPNVPTVEQLSNLELPMEAMPEQRDTVPATNAVNTVFLISGTADNVPWTGYYILLDGARLAVTNIYGVWFELRRREAGFEAHRLVREGLSLIDAPLKGIDYARLRATGEPLTQAPSRAATPAIQTATITDPAAGPPKDQPKKATGWVMPPLGDYDLDEEENVFSSATNRPPRQPGQPGGTGDDPMVLAAMHSAGYLRLEGNPPDRFNGDRARTRRFLTQFRQFMLMNDGATIAQNDIKKCTYFLSLMGGPQVDGWSEMKYDWLDAIKKDPRQLMGHSPWEVMMQDFLDAFTNHAEREQAQNALKQLKMKEGKIDEYITGFERLAHRAGIDLDDPSNMRMFAHGLPGPLVETVLRQDDPQNYVQWREAAQRHQRIWLKIQTHKGSYGSTQPLNRRPSNRGGGQGNNPFNNFYWRRPNQGGQGQQGSRSQPARQRLPPHDPNAMDTSAAARKANTDRDKEEYRKTGRCFECGKQGHLARNCPTKRNRPSPSARPQTNRTASVEEADDTESELDSQAYHWNPEVLAQRAMKFTDEDRDVFVCKLQDLGAETGFLDA